jgi:hypothetical protein
MAVKSFITLATGVFVIVSHFHPRLVFAGKARIYQSVATLFIYSIHFENQDNTDVSNVGARAQCYKTFFVFKI